MKTQSNWEERFDKEFGQVESMASVSESGLIVNPVIQTKFFELVKGTIYKVTPP